MVANPKPGTPFQAGYEDTEVLNGLGSGREILVITSTLSLVVFSKKLNGKDAC